MLVLSRQHGRDISGAQSTNARISAHSGENGRRMADLSPSARRLDSWKAIAEYLQRDVATVRRWEKTLALPVRRVPGGRGHSVFAFTSEIDTWLKTTPSQPSLVTPARWKRRVWLAIGAATVAIFFVSWATLMSKGRVKVSDVRLDVTPTGALAFDPAGRELWRYSFPPAYKTGLSSSDEAGRIVGGSHPAVLIANTHRIRLSDDAAESGALTWLDLEGRVQRTFSFTDQVSLGGTMFGAPWGLNAFAVDDTAGTRRIAVAGHHFVWNPGLVTILDEQWKRTGTFVHDGWIDSVHWMAPNRLLIGGYSNAHEGGVLALLDVNRLDGQGPEPAGTAGHCDTCGPGAPIRMVIMPRSEINQATASPFNHAIVQITGNRVLARTIEIPSAGEESVDAIYEFTPTLDLISASYSDRYWEVHRALEAQGKIDHSRDACPDRDGPRTIQVWEAATGWTTVHTPSAAGASR
jgi:hypothetical protein